MQKAVNATRQANAHGGGDGGGDAIVLRAGVHYLSSTIDLLPSDSGLSISAYRDEEVWVSGGVPLSGLKWSKASTATDGVGVEGASSNIWVADVGGYVSEVKGLNTLSPYRRATRAIYPNGDPASVITHATPLNVPGHIV